MPRTMTRKPHKPSSEPAPGRPSSRRSGKAVQVYLPDELSDALNAYIGGTRPTPTKTAVIEMALEDLLRKAGYLPERKPEGN